MAATIRQRSEIPEQYKWDLSKIFPKDEAWEETFARLDDKITSLSAYAGTLGESPQRLESFFKELFSTEQVFNNCLVYAFLRKNEDTREERAQSMESRIQGKLAQFYAAVSFYEPEVLALSDEKLQQYLDSEALKEYRFTLENLIREKEHTLSEKEEKILAGMSELAQAPSDISKMLLNADMKYTPIRDEKGQEVPVTASNYILLQSSTDPRVRKDSFHSFYKGFAEHINTLTATYANSVKKDVFLARTRNYADARAMAMSYENIPASVYDSLIETVHQHMPAMHRYAAFRKKVLGLEALHYYDLYAPLMGACKLQYDFEQAKEMVLKAVQPLGEEYVQILRQGYADRWVDAYENEGKPSGAFSSGTYDSAPYISMNFTGNLDSVSTLAHESGHSMHTYLANRTQPYHYADYTLFVAEVASTVNENLLIEQRLKEATDPKVRMYLLNQYLENFKGTVYRQTMFAEFEHKAHQIVEQGEALSTKRLCDLYLELVRQYFGEALIIDEEVKYEWARIPHFYRSFYVYKYATGYTSAVALSEGILNEGKSAVDRYLKFLSLGGSKYPLESLKIGGVDLSTPKPVDAALTKFERILEEAEQCFAQLQA